MSVLDLLRLVTQGVFVLIAIVTLVDFLRHRDPPRLDIALMFGALSAIIVIQQIRGAIGLEGHWLRLAGTVLLLAQPVLLLRLVQHFRPVPRTIRGIALTSMVVSWGLLLAVGLPLPAPLTLLVVVSFVAVEGYCAWAFVRGAQRTVGVSHWRLALAAAGSGLLAAVILLAGLSAALPAITSVTTPLVAVLAMLAGISYYAGFAPPRWLRQVWQLIELRRFLYEMAGRSANERATAAPAHLCATGMRVAGGLAAVAAMWDATTQRLMIQATNGQPSLVGALGTDEGAVGRAWRERRPIVAHTPANFGPDEARAAAMLNAGALLAVPIATHEHRWGLLVVFLWRRPLFAADDLSLLALLTEQGAIALDYAALLDEQRAVVAQLRWRSAQLEAANRELEAFSYSVSHDLRAPLRSIDGFSHALLEDYADMLDAVGADYLRRVRVAAQRKGELIDDLLTLSQVTRRDLRREPVDLSALASQIAATLRQHAPQRQVDFAIAAGIVAQGDPQLLRILLENLLSNAWKFTSTHPRACITFGAAQHDGQPVYFVRDDGVGFDMQYAHKLFGAFQRLHPAAVFDGTGIGLATVQRIVHRHGGRVWAEGAVNQDATFSFTLGGPAGSPGITPGT
ncbi:MAG TPA: ATP-binding protein [Roseiflexaceae bacterium]|nr:ATP-binding protein [Roseiflexaceae bacterium]